MIEENSATLKDTPPTVFDSAGNISSNSESVYDNEVNDDPKGLRINPTWAQIRGRELEEIFKASPERSATVDLVVIRGGGFSGCQQISLAGTSETQHKSTERPL